MVYLISILACTGSAKHADPTETQVIEENEVVQGDLNGAFPPENIPAPEFTALNYDGAERTREDLLGHPTVIWFYPLAQTYG